MAQKRRRRDGRKNAADQWERWQFFATTARFVVELLELLRNHITGTGPGGFTL